MKIERMGLSSKYTFFDGKYELKKQHHCSSCGLSDEEWTEIDGYNRAIDIAAKLIEEIENDCRLQNSME